MRNRKTPDVAPGAGNTSSRASQASRAPFVFKNWPPVTVEEIDEDIRNQNAEQEDQRQHSATIEIANRTLRALYHAHPPNAAKSWQRQIALFTRSGYEHEAWNGAKPAGDPPPAPTEPRWGVVAMVCTWSPQAGECLLSWWAPTWRQAIETAVYKMATL